MHGAIPPLPQYVFMVWCLVKHRDNFTFTLCCSEPLVSSFTAAANYCIGLKTGCCTFAFSSVVYFEGKTTENWDNENNCKRTYTKVCK
jgi:hypothetical protein